MKALRDRSVGWFHRFRALLVHSSISKRSQDSKLQYGQPTLVLFACYSSARNLPFSPHKRKVPIGTAPADEARLSPFIRGRGSFDRVV